MPNADIIFQSSTDKFIPAPVIGHCLHEQYLWIYPSLVQDDITLYLVGSGEGDWLAQGNWVSDYFKYSVLGTNVVFNWVLFPAGIA